jgi:NitT/TauT family transport system ATP-binding protein
MLAGFEAPTSGLVRAAGVVVVKPGPKRGVIFQGEDSLYPWLTARENVEFGLRAQGMRPRERRERALKFLAMTGLRDQANKYPSEVSGGMKQRIQIARVLANDPDMLLMDEPFGALDAQTRTVMQRQLAKLWRATRKTVLFITHDIDEALLLGNRIGIMQAGPASRMKAIIEVEGRPERGDTKFGDYYTVIRRLIEEEVTRTLDPDYADWS